VESGNERPLRIVGLKATPMRGEGLVITFALTKPAQVVGEVLTLTGRKIAVMDDGSTRMAGTHRMIWRGVGSEGVKVPVGAYLVRLVATDEDGRQVQAVTVVRSR
jgi:flagellar hook assembly protein FlgD